MDRKFKRTQFIEIEIFHI